MKCRKCGKTLAEGAETPFVDGYCGQCARQVRREEAEVEASRHPVGRVEVEERYFSDRREFEVGRDEKDRRCIRSRYIDGSGPRAFIDRGESADGLRREVEDRSSDFGMFELADE